MDLGTGTDHDLMIQESIVITSTYTSTLSKWNYKAHFLPKSYTGTANEAWGQRASVNMEFGLNLIPVDRF